MTDCNSNNNCVLYGLPYNWLKGDSNSSVLKIIYSDICVAQQQHTKWNLTKWSGFHLVKSGEGRVYSNLHCFRNISGSSKANQSSNEKKDNEKKIIKKKQDS